MPGFPGGAPDRARTDDLLITNQPLYLLSYKSVLPGGTGLLGLSLTFILHSSVGGCTFSCNSSNELKFFQHFRVVWLSDELLHAVAPPVLFSSFRSPFMAPAASPAST